MLEHGRARRDLAPRAERPHGSASAGTALASVGGDQRPVAQLEHPIGPSGDARVVRDEDRRAPARERLQRVEQPVARGLVEAGRRLVEDQHGRVAHERARDRDAPALTARQPPAAGAEAGLVAVGAAPRGPHGRRRHARRRPPARRSPSRPWAIASRAVVSSRQRVLQQQTDVLAQRRQRDAAHVVAVDARSSPPAGRRSARAGSRAWTCPRRWAAQRPGAGGAAPAGVRAHPRGRPLEARRRLLPRHRSRGRGREAEAMMRARLAAAAPALVLALVAPACGGPSLEVSRNDVVERRDVEPITARWLERRTREPLAALPTCPLARRRRRLSRSRRRAQPAPRQTRVAGRTQEQPEDPAQPRGEAACRSGPRRAGTRRVVAGQDRSSGSRSLRGCRLRTRPLSDWLLAQARERRLRMKALLPAERATSLRLRAPGRPVGAARLRASPPPSARMSGSRSRSFR